MSWYGCELITVTLTPDETPSSSSRRAAPRAAHRPAKPEPSTTISLMRSLLVDEYLLGGMRVEQLELAEIGRDVGQRQRCRDRQFVCCGVGAQGEHEIVTDRRQFAGGIAGHPRADRIG